MLCCFPQPARCQACGLSAPTVVVLMRVSTLHLCAECGATMVGGGFVWGTNDELRGRRWNTSPRSPGLGAWFKPRQRS